MGGTEHITSREIIELIREEYEKSRPKRQPGDITVSELAHEMNLPYATAHNYLMAKVRAGELIRISSAERGHRVVLYRKV